jgi:hypothetical protein
MKPKTREVMETDAWGWVVKRKLDENGRRM